MLAAEGRETPMVQRSVKDSSLPVQIRLGFIKKVYGILTVMLMLSFGIASPFVFRKDSTLEFMGKNQWIIGVVSLLLLVHQIVNLVIIFEACCGGGGCMRAYIKMFVTFPLNYMFVLSYATAFGVELGFVCASNEAESLALVFILTAVIMLALTIYAVCTKQDFTSCGPYLFVMLVGLLCAGVVALFFPYGTMLHKLIAGFGAILFSFIIVYDTQMIFGSAAEGFSNSGAARIEYTVDMYCFAAYQLYLDFVNMFLYLLQLFGKRN